MNTTLGLPTPLLYSAKALSAMRGEFLKVFVISAIQAWINAFIYLEVKNTEIPLSINDVWIAALAQENNLPILSKDAHIDFITSVKRIQW
jgi:predicted nucleic acid-binding protein